MLTPRHMSRRLAALAAITGLGVLGATPAHADPGWGSVDCTQTPSPACQLSAGSNAGSAPNGAADHDTAGTGHPDSGNPSRKRPGDQTLANCGYRPSTYRPPPGAAGSGATPTGGQWLDRLCSASAAIQGPDHVTTLTPAEIGQLARRQLHLPTPDLAANPRTDQLVNLPTWLWLEDGWKDVRATASVPGVSITATARPRSVTWSMGDGETVRCTGPGTPFRAGTDPRAASPDCGYTYRRSSATRPRGVFPVSATVHWSVGWSGAGQSGTFPDLTTTSATRFRVAESQALNISPPGR
jgi:hypothetical protein